MRQYDKDGALRLRSERYLNTVRGQLCLICGKIGEAHHVNHAQERGINLRVGDQFTVPLCRVCHMDLHRFGDEGTWWDINGIAAIRWANENFEKFCVEFGPPESWISGSSK